MEQTLQSLEVYHLAKSIGNSAWNIFNSLPKQFQYSIGNQFLRAADSISANIAEGYGRYHYKESIQFNNYARGSAYETIDWIDKLNSRKLVEKKLCEALEIQLKQVILKINGYNKYLRSKFNQ